MLSYRKLAMRVLGRPLHTEGISSPHPASQRAAAFILTAAMLTTLAAPAFADIWHIEDGDITVKASGTEGKNTVSQGNKKDVEDTNTIITNRDKNTASSHTVTIEAGNDKVEVTLKDVNIKADSGSALTSKGDVTLTLKGDNHLTGGISDNGNYGLSGISSSGSLTISGGETDSLTAQGGSGTDGSGGRSITISGGTVDAKGGNSGTGDYSSGGSGICNGGSGIDSGNITISGGTVNATGGNDGNGNYGYGGSGIYSSVINLSGSLELTAKAGSPNGKALSRAGYELDLNDIKDKLGPGAKVTATDANGETKQVSIPRPVEPEESSSSAAPSAPASPLPGLTVTDKDGQRISYTSIRGNNVLSIRVGRFTASFRISLATLRQLRAEGIDTITFQTILCSTTLSVDELLAMGGEDTPVALAHSMGTARLTVGGEDHSELLK